MLAATGIELDTVEIKGHCATLSWMDGMPKHTAGTLAKLPRDWERFDELRNSPTYTAHQLLAVVTKHPVEAEEHAPKVQRMRREGSVPLRGVDPGRIELWLAFGMRFFPQTFMSGKATITAWS